MGSDREAEGTTPAAQVQHTEGPFYIYKDEDGHAISVNKYVVGNNGGTAAKTLCQMPVVARKVHRNAEMTRAEIDANAALFRAAPDLLEALCDLLSYHDAPGPVDAPLAPLMRNAFAAIRKATGQ